MTTLVLPLRVQLLRKSNDMPQGFNISPATLPLPTALEQQAAQCLRSRTLDVLSSYLADIGVVDRTISPAEWVSAHHLPRYFEQWMHESIRLCTDHLATPTEAAWRAWNEDRSVWFEMPTLRGKGVLAEATLNALPRILRGECTALEIMFPRSSQSLVQAVHGGNLRSDYFHHLAGKIAHEHITWLIENRSSRIRILEIGAGTGSTTARVLDALENRKEHIELYCYTDVSR